MRLRWSWWSPAAIISAFFKQWTLNWGGTLILENTSEYAIGIENVNWNITPYTGISGRLRTPRFDASDRIIPAGETWSYSWSSSETGLWDGDLSRLKLESVVVRFVHQDTSGELAIPYDDHERSAEIIGWATNLRTKTVDELQGYLATRSLSGIMDVAKLTALRFFPIYDLKDKKFYTLDGYTKKLVSDFGDDRLAGTHFGQDPLGVSYRMLYDESYAPDDVLIDLDLADGAFLKGSVDTTPAPLPTPTPAPSPTPTPLRAIITVDAGFNQAILLGETAVLSGASGKSSHLGELLGAAVDWADGAGFVNAGLIQSTGEIIASHQYSKAGVYLVRVKVLSNEGDFGTDTVAVMVSPVASPPPTPTPAATALPSPTPTPGPGGGQD